MNVTFFNNLKRYYYQALGFFPTRLPVGLTAFNEWCERLRFTYFPLNASPPDEASFRFSIAAMVMHLDSQSDRKPNRFFGKAIYKGAANEVASYTMHDLKAKRDALIAAQEAEILRQRLASTETQDATTSADAVADGPTQ